MRVVALNCSPNKDEGNTALILRPFLEGMREAGAEVELVYIEDKEINPCRACYSCWLKTPGECIQSDDVEGILEKLRVADTWVFAAPVYFGGVPGPTKNLMDRMVPLGVPFTEIRDDHCRMKLREGTRTGHVVLVSTCFYWESDSFDPLLAHMIEFSATLNREFAGALLRAHFDALRAMIEMGAPVDDIFEAAREAGRQLVNNTEISTENLEIISRELVPLREYIETSNLEMQQALDRIEK